MDELNDAMEAQGWADWSGLNYLDELAAEGYIRLLPEPNNVEYIEVVEK